MKKIKQKFKIESSGDTIRNMEIYESDSTSIAGARWIKGDSITEDGNILGELVITFKNNTQYRYHEVPASVAFNFLHADSLGVYFSQNIKEIYKFDKI